MKFIYPKVTVLLSALAIPGCAELYLDAARQGDEFVGKRLNNYQEMRDIAACIGDTDKCTIDGAIELAFQQADAYAKAARHTQATQDVLTLGLVRAAGLVVSGAASGASDGALADRAIDAALVQQVGSRFTPRTAVQALYTGASRMNCIAMAGSLYMEIDLEDMAQLSRTTDIPVKLASFTMVLAMREVEYRTLYGTSRELGDFSTLLAFFEAATTDALDTNVIVEEQEGEAQTSGNRITALSGANVQRTVTIVRQNPALERFFAVVKGCLEDATIAPDSTAGTN